jgi:hypothetical protein
LPKKGDHILLRRLITVVDQRLPFTDQVTRLRRQRQWLIDLAHLLDPTPQPSQPPPTSQSVAQTVDRYLVDLIIQVAAKADQQDQIVAAHIEQTFRNRWWGLFICYDVDGLPRTNNELETYMRRIKTGQRRISGRKNVHHFVIRYGRYVTCVDYQENLDELLSRLQQVSHDDFLCQRQALDTALLREQKQHRFRHHRDVYLRELEERWVAAIEQINS